MCGIVGYVGKEERKLAELLLTGLKRLEYRGYDSAGIAIVGANKKLHGRMPRPTGGSAIDKLIQGAKDFDTTGKVGIAHTRWATHGEPSERNAHPHVDCNDKIFLVHNGIIENFSGLKEILLKRGHEFTSDTDSEVIVHLIEENYQGDLFEAVRMSLQLVRGTFGIAVICENELGNMVIARRGSPLGIGVCDGEYIIASDATPILPHTKQMVYLEDDEIALINAFGYKISSLKTNGIIKRKALKLDWDIADAEKEGFAHFMLKEICEQPDSIYNSMRGRIDLMVGDAVLGGLRDRADRLRQIKHLHIIACGTAYYAARVGKYMIEENSGVSVNTDSASEFRYRSPVLDPKRSALLVISQSGETADTLAVVREAKKRGLLVLGMVNAVGSTIARETDAGVYNHAGPEIGVASTKAFTSQLTILALLTMFLGRQRAMSETMGHRIAKSLHRLSEQVLSIMTRREQIKEIAKRYAHYKNFLFLGRKYNFPIALEGALKLKEISYIHAEGYGAGEMKHGPLALIDENFPSFCIVPDNSVREKMISNMQEIKARKGKIVAIVSEGDKEIADMVDDCIFIPRTEEMLEPILTVIPLQLFAYYVAVALGKDVDKPRNLAKSVTVE
ncbi:glutamine--fructose-6-phosphate transaminase (isomerizing) [Patescibacteria group bacterium]